MSIPSHDAWDLGIPPEEVFWDRLEHPAGHCRRSVPRVHANVAVHIGLANGVTLELTSNDLAACGMQLRCDRTTAEKLRSASLKGRAGAPTYPITLDIELDGEVVQVGAHARIAHLTLVSDAPPPEEVAIGFELMRFADGGEHALQRYVEHHLRPASVKRPRRKGSRRATAARRSR
jgi:hypothetical protein